MGPGPRRLSPGDRVVTRERGRSASLRRPGRFPRPVTFTRGRHDRRRHPLVPRSNRLFVVLGAALLLVWGGYTAWRMPVDVFPDLTAPTVTVLTEAHGMAPEEVETRSPSPSRPRSTVHRRPPGALRHRGGHLGGLGGVRLGHRHLPGPADRGGEAPARRALAAARSRPSRRSPPSPRSWGRSCSSRSTSDKHTPIELKTTADWVVRKRLLAVPGVSQVIPIGGEHEAVPGASSDPAAPRRLRRRARRGGPGAQARRTGTPRPASTSRAARST